MKKIISAALILGSVATASAFGGEHLTNRSNPNSRGVNQSTYQLLGDMFSKAKTPDLSMFVEKVMVGRCYEKDYPNEIYQGAVLVFKDASAGTPSSPKRYTRFHRFTFLNPWDFFDKVTYEEIVSKEFWNREYYSAETPITQDRVDRWFEDVRMKDGAISMVGPKLSSSVLQSGEFLVAEIRTLTEDGPLRKGPVVQRCYYYESLY